MKKIDTYPWPEELASLMNAYEKSKLAYDKAKPGKNIQYMINAIKAVNISLSSVLPAQKKSHRTNLTNFITELNKASNNQMPNWGPVGKALKALTGKQGNVVAKKLSLLTQGKYSYIFTTVTSAFQSQITGNLPVLFNNIDAGSNKEALSVMVTSIQEFSTSDSMLCLEYFQAYLKALGESFDTKNIKLQALNHWKAATTAWNLTNHSSVTVETKDINKNSEHYNSQEVLIPSNNPALEAKAAIFGYTQSVLQDGQDTGSFYCLIYANNNVGLKQYMLGNIVAAQYQPATSTKETAKVSKEMAPFMARLKYVAKGLAKAFPKDA